MPVQWVEGLPPKRAAAATSEDEKIARELKGRPGQWALIAKNQTHASATAKINRGGSAFAPKGAFEAVSRSTASKGKIDIYARYVGKGDADKSK